VGAELEQEQRLRRAERLASVGTLVSGVAHELNNPLAAIVGFTQLLLMDERPAAEREDLETIGREAQRMAEIVSNLRILARGTQEERRTPQPVDVGDVVRHVLRTRGYTLRTHNIEVREDVDPDLPPALGDRAQIEQVVLNLVVNAEQAIGLREAPGLLVVRARPSRVGVSLQVVDNGPGIAAEHLERIFDPFFTTKRPGEGTGLGLSLVHSIVEEHGGQIHVDSQVGAGTAFRVELPAAEAASGRGPDGGAGAGGGPDRPLRVLVVDDEEPVRRAIARYLGRRGHTADEAADGAEALERLDAAARSGRGYDVVVSDLRMPGLGGRQLLARMRERGDDAWRRVVFLTGDTAGEEVERVLAEAELPVLTKPVDLGALVAMVERAAGHARGTAPGDG
jgi:CheY-like chemotaxis protein